MLPLFGVQLSSTKSSRLFRGVKNPIKHHETWKTHLVSLLPDLVLHGSAGHGAILALPDAGALSVLLLRQLQSDEHDPQRLDFRQPVQDVLPLDDAEHLDDVASGHVDDKVFFYRPLTSGQESVKEGERAAQAAGQEPELHLVDVDLVVVRCNEVKNKSRR